MAMAVMVREVSSSITSDLMMHCLKNRRSEEAEAEAEEEQPVLT